MKINLNNQDLKIERNYEHSCCSCAFNNDYIYPCILFGRPDKIWIKNRFNSDIFKV